MTIRVWHKALFALLGLLLFSAASHAASLDKIEVASRLGEPFYAEVPLKLEEHELPSKVFVEIASSADYRIFEVYRDPVLNAIRADVASDERGARVELSSRSTIKAPFFNLVLKIRYGRVSHFKKYPVFLDSAKSISEAADKAPQPSVQAVKSGSAGEAEPALTESAGKPLIAEQAAPQAAKEVTTGVKYFDGWARIGRYGPIVRGDSLSTVAERLRIDYRYTRNQIMLALFNKNRDSFEQNNMNLMKAGSYLDVPLASEIEKIGKDEAYRAFVEHEKAWQQLTSQPRYAAEAEAQRTRYMKRVRVGEKADGVAAAPAVASDSESTTAAADRAAPVVADLLQPTGDQAAPQQPAEQLVQAQNETNQLLARLQERNEQLQQQLIDNQKNVAALSQKVDDVATAASKARIEKLEILLTRLQAELEKDRQQAQPVTRAATDWVLWILIGLVVVLLGVVAVLMRREPAHPAVIEERKSEPVAARDVAESEALAAAIEDEVAGIETGETETPASAETATIDSMPAFTDELTDTDTSELEPFDADAHQEPDPNVDYLAEADVYIRYGMDDEALQQLDMALKLQPDNVDAHIKKAELLLGKNDRQGFDETIAAATMTLAAIDLDRFKSSIEQLDGDKPETAPDADADEQSQRSVETVPLDETGTDTLDFDLSDMEVPDAGSDEDAGEERQFETRDLKDAGEMDWLNDVSFEAEGKAENTASEQQDEAISEDETSGATQELDNLLTEFSEKEASESEPVSEGGQFEPGATQQLDRLLSEFDDDDEEISFVSTESGIDASLIEQGIAEAEAKQDDEIGIDTDHGATQELDSLLAEFADEEDAPTGSGEVSGLDASFFEPTGSEESEEIGIDTDHGATQELDNLLMEFSEEDELVRIDSDQSGLDADAMEQQKTESGQQESGAGATQVLGHLLDEFKDEEEDDKKG